MKYNLGPTEAGKQYAAAYAVHYEKKNFREALILYKRLIAMHRNSREAVYSYSQIQNIIGHVIPEQKLLDVQVDLALSYLQQQEG